LELVELNSTYSSCLASEQAGDNHPISKANTPALVEEGVDVILSNVQLTLNLDIKQTVEPDIDMDVTLAPASMSRPHSSENSARSVEPQHQSSSQPSPEQAPGHEQDGSSSDIAPEQALEAALQEATAQADVQSDTGSVSDVEMTDYFAPDHDVLAPASAEDSRESSQQPNGLIESSGEPTVVADGESDPYEPPEATPPPADALPAPDSPPFSPAPPEEVSGSSNTDKQQEDISTGPDEVTASKAALHIDDLALLPAPANQVFSSALDESVVG
jgi:hypothetical protein